MEQHSVDGVRLDVDGAVATVTLCRPAARNAQLPSHWAALADIGAGLDELVRVVVVRGEGTSFSAGLDRRILDGSGVPGEPSLWDLAALPAEGIDARIAGFQAGFGWLRRADLVTIAAVQGHAVGAGFQLALACDLRVLADDARLAMRETSLGLVPDLTGTYPLVRAVGYARALEICLTGRWVDAAEAAQLGLATVVVPAAELDAAVDDLVAAVLASPIGAVRATKALLQGAVSNDRDGQDRAERAAQIGRLRELVGPVGESAPSGGR
jgi:enoyl-CoA hydratase/carnithine racemase